MKIFITGFLTAATIVLMAGCVVGPNYHPPQPEVAKEFGELPKDASATPLSRPVAGVEAITRWWFVFRDPELNSLIERAARNNLDLQSAVSRVREARAQRAAINASLWPEVNATAGYNRGHGSENVVLPFGGSGNSSAAAPTQNKITRSESAESSDSASGGNANSGGGAGAGGASSPFGQGGLPGVTTNLYQVGLDASWEIDVFGASRRGLEVAGAEVAAAEEEQRGAIVSLLGEVAVTYVEFRATQQRLHLARENLTAQQDTLKIVEAKFKHGLGNELDVARQRAQRYATAAVIPALVAVERNTEHALAFLINEKPDALTGELAPVQASLPLPMEVPVGVPSDLLRRRPDIRQAERKLAAATARVGVASADWWPRFSLTGAVGFDSSDAKNLVDWPSHYYSIVPGIRWPILDWGRIRANVRVTNERQQQAFLGYSQVVARALKDVEDALVNYEEEQAREAALASAVEASRQARQLAQQNYDHGVIDLLGALEAQRALLENEDALAQSDSALRRNLIALYKALGGGWE